MRREDETEGRRSRAVTSRDDKVVGFRGGLNGMKECGHSREDCLSSLLSVILLVKISVFGAKNGTDIRNKSVNIFALLFLQSVQQVFGTFFQRTRSRSVSYRDDTLFLLCVRLEVFLPGSRYLERFQDQIPWRYIAG